MHGLNSSIAYLSNAMRARFVIISQAVFFYNKEEGKSQSVFNQKIILNSHSMHAENAIF